MERAEFFIEHYTTFPHDAFRYLLEEAGYQIQLQKDILEPSGKETIYGFAVIKE